MARPAMTDPDAGMAAAPAPEADQDQDQDEDQDQDMDQGYVIVIAVHGDGTYSVSQEPMGAMLGDEDEDRDQAAARGGPGPGAAPDTGRGGAMAGEEQEVYTSPEEALRAVAKIMRDNPMEGSEESQYQAGYRDEGGPTMAAKGNAAP